MTGTGNPELVSVHALSDIDTHTHTGARTHTHTHTHRHTDTKLACKPEPINLWLYSGLPRGSECGRGVARDDLVPEELSSVDVDVVSQPTGLAQHVASRQLDAGDQYEVRPGGGARRTEKNEDPPISSRCRGDGRVRASVCAGARARARRTQLPTLLSSPDGKRETTNIYDGLFCFDSSRS